MFDLTRDGTVATFTLSGEPLDRATARALTAAAEAVADDRRVRAFAVTSLGDDFCPGQAADLDAIDVVPDPASMLAHLRVPVIAAIPGRCHDVGLELALACDIRIAGPDADLRLGQIARGTLPCWGGTQRLPRTIRPAEATAMTLLGSSVGAAKARQIGLVHIVADDFLLELGRVIDQLSGVGPLAAELAKEAVHRGAELPLRDGLRLEADLNHQLAATEDRAEGLAAFFDKRPPDFAGR